MEKTCAICWQDLNDETCSKFSCKHDYFHENCIRTWILQDSNKSCPICRSSMGVVRGGERLWFGNILVDLRGTCGPVFPLKYVMGGCTDTGHNVVITRAGNPPFGVIGHCHDCNKIKCFNWLY